MAGKRHVCLYSDQRAIRPYWRTGGLRKREGISVDKYDVANPNDFSKNHMGRLSGNFDDLVQISAPKKGLRCSTAMCQGNILPTMNPLRPYAACCLFKPASSRSFCLYRHKRQSACISQQADCKRWEVCLVLIGVEPTLIIVAIIIYVVCGEM